ncbi:MAG TPA: multiheme c-type cytochrome [Acidobacteriaceae bacterium]|jgi:tetratricopeptide (TPR) repeat protein|nr:multiheme c-type cytochrome [Acidobacteriaceae bacterium]
MRRGLRLLYFLLLAAGPARPQATPVRIADAACERCHQQIFRSYLLTPMANASGAAADRLISGTFDHRSSGVEYTIADQGGMPTLAWRDPSDGRISGRRPLTYFLGSGHLGTTWLYSLDDYLFESPIAWYAASRGFDMKPGLENTTTMPPSLPMQSSCLRCHMSAVQPSDAGTVNRYSGLPFLHAGITCESCHGDTTRHVLSGGKAPVINPAKLDAEDRDSICISCHLEGDVSVERAGHTALDYRPGQAISEYLAYYVYADSNLTRRGVSEVEQLSQSTCKRMSGDKMSCASCHDPHFTPSPSERVAFFRSKCLACHTTPGFATSHHPAQPDCTSCHMPHLGAQNIPHVAWTDHRILRRPEIDSPDAVSGAPDRLVPIFSPGASPRDLGMAWYLALMHGNRGAEPHAWSILSFLQQSIRNDAPALDALGNLSVERGDSKTAEAAFRRVLVLDPSDLTALSNLGVLLAKQSRFADSIAMLRQAFDRNRDVAGLAMNLARVQCMTGDRAGVRSTLQSALIFNPGIAAMRQLLARASSCSASGPQEAQP